MSKLHPPRLHVLFLLSLLFPLSGLCGTAPAQDAPPETAVAKGETFALHYHGGDQAHAEQALAAIEPVWSRVAAAFGKKGAKPTRLLEVHLYRDIAGYEAAEQRLTQGKFRRNLAMAHFETNSAHVAVQPPCTDEALRALGLPGQTIELLAWEVTHIVRRELLTHPDWPMWLVDGFAAHISSHLRAEQLGLKEILDLPRASTNVVRVQRLQEREQMPPATAILADRIDELDFGDRYAARAVFFEFLSSRAYAPKLAKVLGVVRSTGGGRDYKDQVLTAAKAKLGRGVDAAFAKFVAEQEPRWSEVYRSLAPIAGGWQQIAFPGNNAIAWSETPVRGGSVRISGRMRILPADARQLNVLFGRNEQGDFFSVAFTADHGFTAFAYRAQGNQWERIGQQNVPALRLGYATPFVVEAKGETLHVEIGEQEFDVKLPHALPDAVVWGLGAQAGRAGATTGSAGLWLGVTAGPAQDTRGHR